MPGPRLTVEFLRATDLGHSHEVSLLQDSATVANGPVTLNPSFLDQMAQIDVTSIDPLAASVAGHALTQKLLPTNVQDELATRLRAGFSGRITIRYIDVPQLDGCPWELLTLDARPDQQLALNPRISLVREAVKRVGSEAPKLRCNEDVNVVFASASPKGLAELDFSHERNAVQIFARANDVHVVFAENATTKTIQQAIADGYAAIFYFTGHATVRTRGDSVTTVLRLVAPNGGAEDVDWHDIQRQFSRRAPLVVVLNACVSVGTGGRAVLSNAVSECLGVGGSRSLIGYRNKARTDIAAVLAENVLGAVFGAQAIDAVVAKSRRRAAQLEPHACHWANYVLYSDDPEPVAELVPEPQTAPEFFTQEMGEDETLRKNMKQFGVRLVIALGAIMMLPGVLRLGGRAIGLFQAIGLGDDAELLVVALGGLLVLVFGLCGLVNAQRFLSQRANALNIVITWVTAGSEVAQAFMIRMGTRMLTLNWMSRPSYRILRRLVGQVVSYAGGRRA